MSKEEFNRKKIKVSIIVPIYNCEKYIQKCIESLLFQETDVPYEVIAVNDGSTDRSLEILNLFENEKLIVCDKSNGGTSSAKNYGIDCAHGEYIMFVDGDDYVSAAYIQDMFDPDIKYMDMVAAGYSVVYEKTGKQIDNVPEVDGRYCSDKIGRMLEIFGCTGLLNVDVSKMYRRDILEINKIRFPLDMDMGEDLVFNCEYLFHVDRYVILSVSHYYYIRREEVSLVNRYRENFRKMADKSIRSVEKLYELHMTAENRQCLSDFYIDNMRSEIINLYRSGCRLKLYQKVQEIHDIAVCNNAEEHMQYTTREDKLSRLFIKEIKKGRYQVLALKLSILFIVRNHFKRLYIHIRDRLLFD